MRDVNALRAELSGQGLGESALGKFAGCEGGAVGAASDGGGGAGED